MTDGNRTSDAAEVGQALAFPGDLRKQLTAMATHERPVRDAVQAGWARLEELRLLTAALNGSVAAGRVRLRGERGTDEEFDGGDAGGRAVVVAVEGGVEGRRSLKAASGDFVEMPVAAAPVAAEEGVGSQVGEAVEGTRVAPGGVERLAGSGGDAGGLKVEVGQAAAPRIAGQREMAGYPSLGRYDVPGTVRRADGMEATAPLRAAGGVERGSVGGVVLAAGAGALRADVGRALRERGVQDRAGSVAPGQMADMAQVVGWAAEGERRRGAAADGRRMAGEGEGEGGKSFFGGGSAAAPMPQERGGDAGGVGTVMLDGRVVGQWLSERMARDAARPGAGTTFFDPRQAPAWTPSGAV